MTQAAQAAPASIKALIFERKELRFAAAMAVGRLKPGSGAGVGPLRLTETVPPELPGDDWHYVYPALAGICGSDLATVDGRVSRYFEPLVSFPFVPGHEVVGRVDDGTRVVLEPVLGHRAHGFAPPWRDAAPADGHDYGHLIGGRLEAGLQTGSCASTGGGWSEAFAAHESQLHSLGSVDSAGSAGSVHSLGSSGSAGSLDAAELSDEAAVMIEPTAAGVHAALRAEVAEGGTAAVIGAGTMGLAAVAALRRLTGVAVIVVGARYGHQRRLARELGADLAVSPDELGRAVRRATGTRVIGETLGSGTHVTIDAVASSESLRDAIAITRPRGRVVVLGMPADVELNLSALWHRETELIGAYCYGTEPSLHGAHTFKAAAGLVRDCDLGRLVSETYRLEDYRAALDHAANAGARGSVKIAFDLRNQ
ncbi:zinc-dependent alcohol dehydrogenase [Candidatus Poriferisodalis sp.]|uniref:zinc-dependent alcohol dehydrogenase n=1 Tax=Candidatus Poriferisodalis sp. TaxID=3101277 RepID=UPI003B01A99F